MKLTGLVGRSTVVASLLVFGAHLHCSSTEPAPQAGSVADGRYRGTLAGEGDLAGTIELTVGNSSGIATQESPTTQVRSNLSGTVTVNIAGVGPISVTGSVDLDARTVTFSGTAGGGAVTFTGRYENGILSGQVTTPWGPASFTLTNEQLGGLKVYCGTFGGTLQGRWNLFAAGGRAGGVFAAVSGERGILGGTSNATSMTLQVPPSGTATGAIAGGAISGDWSNGAGQAGRFTASEAACAALTPRNGSVGDAGTDGSIENDGGIENDASLPALEKIHDIANGSYRNITASSLGGHFVVDAIPNQVWFAASPQNKTKIHEQANVYAIATNGKDIFFAGTDLTAMSAIGSNIRTVAATLPAGSSELYADGTDVYVGSDNGTIGKYAGSDGASGGAYANQANLRGLTGDASDLYYATIGSFVQYTGRGVWRAPKTMVGTPAVVIPAEDFGSATTRIIQTYVEGNDLFAMGFDNTPTYRILSRPKDGSGTTISVQVSEQITYVAADSSYLYYIDYDSTRPQGLQHEMWRVARANLTGQRQSLRKGNAMNGLSVNATHIYFTEGNSLYRMLKP